MWLLSISNLTFIVVLARVDQIPSAMQLQTGVLNPLRCKLGFGDISAITKPSTTSPYFTDYLLFNLLLTVLLISAEILRAAHTYFR